MYKLYSLTGVGKGYYGNDYLKLGSSNLVYIGDDGGNLDNLQSITDNGSITTNIVDAFGFKDTSDVDYLLSLNNKHLTIGDVGSDYNGDWTKYFSVFDPMDYPQGFDFYIQDNVDNGTLNVYGDVSNSESTFNIYSNGNSGSAFLNVRSIGNNYWYVPYSLELGSSGASSSYMKLDTVNNELDIQSNNIRFRNSFSAPYVKLGVSSVTSNRVLDAPDESGIIATREWVTVNSSGGNLQDVTDIGNTTTNEIIVDNTILISNKGNNFCTFLGKDTGTGSIYNYVTAVGSGAGQNASSISSNQQSTYVGMQAGLNSQGQYETIIGSSAGRDSYATESTFVGASAGYGFKNAIDGIAVKATFVGRGAGNTAKGDRVTGIGAYAFPNLQVNSNIIHITSDGSLLAYPKKAATSDNQFIINTNEYVLRFNTGISKDLDYSFVEADGSLSIIGTIAPISASDTGVLGEIRIPNDGYVYFCVAVDTWQRVAISTW